MNKTDNLQKHVIFGITRTIPFIVLFSVLLALSEKLEILGLFSDIIMYSIPVIITVLIVYSYRRFDLLLTGITLGLLTAYNEVGILGGILAGTVIVLTDMYISKYNKNKNVHINFGVNLLLLTVLIPLFYYVINKGISFALFEINGYILNLPTTSTYLIVILLAVLMTIDLGGPFNKLSFSLTIEFFLNGHYNIVGPVLACVMVPPLALFIATYIYKDRFNDDDIKQRKFALFSSFVGMSEGALLISFRRIKIIPILILGSICTSIYSVIVGLENRLLLSGVPAVLGVNSILHYIIAVLVGVLVIVSLLPFVIKRNNVIIENS